jgi:hypothetical protein
LNAATTFEWLAPKLEAIARKPTTEAPDAMGSRMTPRESLMRVAGNLRDAAVSLRTGKDRQGALMRPDEVGKGLLRLWRVCDQADWSLPIAATYNACFQEIVDCLNRMKVEAEGLAGCS